VLAVSDYAGELEQAIETTADVVGCPEVCAGSALGWASGNAGVG
jgi:hypothetical protein